MTTKKVFLILFAVTLCVSVALNSFGQSDSVREAKALDLEWLKLARQGHYAEAVQCAIKASSIYEQTFGPEHPHTATSLSNVAMLYDKMGANEKAEALFVRAFAIREKALGPDHPHTVAALKNLASLYSKIGNYAKAEPLFKRALAINEKTRGPEHPDTASSLNDLAWLYNRTGAYAKAEPLFKRALAINEKTHGPEHAATATSLNNLASLYEDMGAYGRAEPLYRRALVIRQKALKPAHPDIATTLNNLAKLYTITGAFDKAEPLYKRALTIREKALGPEHPNTATTLNNLASLYYLMGAYDKAEPLLKRSLTIREKALGPEHPATAQSLNNLALLYDRTGAYNKAELLYKRSVAMHEKALGLEHPNTAQALSALASLYDRAGAHAQAEPLLKRSLAIRKKALGQDHPDTARSLNSLALLYDRMGDYAKAEPLYRRSLAIYEKALGPEHRETAISLNNLAGLYATLGRNLDSITLMERAQAINRKQIEQVIGFAPEEQQSKFLATSAIYLNSYLSLVHQQFIDDPRVKRNALNIWLSRKGILMEAQKGIRDVLANGDDSRVAGLFSELTRVRGDLAKLILGGPGAEGAEAYQKQIADLTSRKETLEGRLSRLSKSFAKRRKTTHATMADVAALLPPATVLIEIARIQDFLFKESKWGAFRYLAFVLPPGSGGAVSLVDLGDAKEIDEKVNTLKKSLREPKTPNETLMGQSKELYQRIFAPLKSAIGTAKGIFLSSDGSLNLIPFEVLQDDSGRHLIETYSFNYVAAGRDIAGFGVVKERGKRVLLIGDPDFNLASEQQGDKAEFTVTRSHQMTRLKFTPLPGTRDEVEAISRLLSGSDCDTYLGKDARESVLLAGDSPRILHLATHGFFLSDQDWTSLADENSRGITIKGKDQPYTQKPDRVENPFLRCGLALAGANSPLAGDRAVEGILTGEKILGLNLRGTDMVVLSACETGVGQIKNGEGVYGLRRAFSQAGAKSLVMSMWEVPDVETKELMINFYSNLQSGKMNRAEALRQAVLKQKKLVKDRYGNDHPFYWGAFVFLGEAE